MGRKWGNWGKTPPVGPGDHIPPHTPTVGIEPEGHIGERSELLLLSCHDQAGCIANKNGS